MSFAKANVSGTAADCLPRGAMEPPAAAPRMSVIIPAYNAAAELADCLAALAAVEHRDTEYIVVDDGSGDDIAHTVRQSRLPIRLIRRKTRSGPAAARNEGARYATSEILVFLDADVCVHADTLARVERSFHENPELRAVLGSYDDNPSAPGFHSQFRNLLHCYIHQNGRGRACTFWTGCGAIYREDFERLGGFNEHLGGMDDIELGGRLVHTGARVELRPEIQVQHRKRWTFFSWTTTDLLLRGIPWTLVLLRDRNIPDALNVSYRNRASVALLLCGIAASLAAFIHADAALAALVLFAAVFCLNRGLYSFLRERRGLRFAAAGAGAHWIHLLVCGLSLVCGGVRFAFSRHETKANGKIFDNVHVLEKAVD